MWLSANSLRILFWYRSCNAVSTALTESADSWNLVTRASLLSHLLAASSNGRPYQLKLEEHIYWMYWTWTQNKVSPIDTQGVFVCKRPCFHSEQLHVGNLLHSALIPQHTTTLAAQIPVILVIYSALELFVCE